MAIKIKPKSFLTKKEDNNKIVVKNISHIKTDNDINKNSAKDAISKTVKKDKDNKEDKIYNGVYLIENSVTGRKYVGSSSNLYRRIKTHKQHLEKGCHNNRRLQKDHDIHGMHSLKFIILEKDVAHDLLTAYEKYWIYKHDAIVKYKGYNDVMPTLNHSALKHVYNLKEGLSK